MRALILPSLAAALLVSACTRSLPGILTLAPAGMTTSGTCTPQADGTLVMHPGATAESTVYVDAGSVRITVTAQAAPSSGPTTVELWFAGSQVGTVHLESTQAQAFPFQVQARASGPTALRVAVPSLSEAAPDHPALHLQKIVITQP